MTIDPTRPKEAASPSSAPVEEGPRFLPTPPNEVSSPKNRSVVPVGIAETIDFWAATLDDTEKNRKATENRLRSLQDTEWGHGLDDSDPVLMTIRTALAEAEGFEKAALFQLRAAFRHHPLYEPVITTHGLGWKAVARYVAAVGGDPYWHSRDDRPRTLGELYAYSGLHVTDGAAPRRRSGMQSNWSSQARTRAWLIATPVIKIGGPFRAVYEEARVRQVDAVHTVMCRNTIRPVGGKPAGSNGCGTQAHPEWGEPGSPLRPGHQHARGIRAVAKAVVADLWAYMRALHGAAE